MKLQSVVFVSCMLLLECNVASVLCASTDGQCVSLVKGPFDICTKAGYNNTLPYPEELTEKLKTDVATYLPHFINYWENCSAPSLATAMECAYLVPKCSSGKRVYPCRRVCGELLKRCNMNQMGDDEYREIYRDFVLATCVILPNATASSNKCFEPPNFTVNNSVPSPLDRGCQKLIFPACKNLSVYNYTLFSESAQKKLYKLVYNRTYDEGDLEVGFPKFVEKELAAFPKCQANIKKLFCGEIFSPCFPGEGPPGLKTLCRSVCNDIVRDCPTFFKNHNFMDAEYCGMLPEGSTSHGFCDRKEWPKPFYWVKYFLEPTEAPSPEPESQGPKAWVIAVAVVVPMIIVGFVLAGVIWWRFCSRMPRIAYKKHDDDVASLDP